MVGKVGGGPDCGSPYATPRVVFVTCKPSEHINVVRSVGLNEPRGSAWQNEVPHATFRENVGAWEDLVADVVEVQLGDGEEIGVGESDALPW